MKPAERLCRFGLSGRSGAYPKRAGRESRGGTRQGETANTGFWRGQAVGFPARPARLATMKEGNRQRGRLWGQERSEEPVADLPLVTLSKNWVSGNPGAIYVGLLEVELKTK